MKIGKGAFKKINTAAQVYFMPYQVFKTTFIACFHEQGHKYIADGMGGRAGKTGRNIRYAIVYNAVFNKNRMLVGSDLGGFKTTAPVYAHINNYTAGAHIAHHFICNHYRRTAGLGR